MKCTNILLKITCNLLFMFSASVAHSAYIYEIQGNNFESASGVYDLSMSVTGSFTLDNPLPHNQNFDIAAMATGFDFFDGFFRYTNANSSITGSVTTNASGQISDFFIRLSSYWPTPGAIGDLSYKLDVSTTFDDAVEYECHGLSPDLARCQTGGGISNAHVNYNTRTHSWTGREVIAPEPTTLALMGLGLAGIGYRRYKKAA